MLRSALVEMRVGVGGAWDIEDVYALVSGRDGPQGFGRWGKKC